jgi:ABC-type amino acid transport substrate-binding protein
MMNLRSLVLGFATVLAALPAAAESQAPDRLQMILDRGVLRVGTTMDTPVFSMRDAATGKLHGLDMDVLETLNTSLGVKLEYVKMTFGSMLADLAADKFDIAMSGMGRTLDRARVATFSKPYMRYGKLLLIRSADQGRFKTLADLDRPGLKIAYNRGGLNDRGDLHGASEHAARGDEPGQGVPPDLRGDSAAAGRPDAAQLHQHLARPDRAGRYAGQDPHEVAGRHEVVRQAVLRHAIINWAGTPLAAKLGDPRRRK